MKLKERKGNESEKQVKPVKKTVALVLTIVTVFAFAAACFSLGFCSGKKANEAYAASESNVFFYLVEEPDVSVNLTFSGTFKWGSSLFLGFSIANNELRATTLSSYKVIYSAADGWNTSDTSFNSTLMKYMYFQFTAPSGEVAYWLHANSVKTSYVPFLMVGSYTFKDSWLSNNESYNSSFIFTANEETYKKFYIIYDSSNGISIKYDNTIAFTRDSGWSTGYQTIKISEASAVSSFDFYSNFLTSTATYSSSTEPATYTIEAGEYKGINTPTFPKSDINQEMTFTANNITYQEMRIRPARNNIIYWDEALEYGYTAYNGAWQENSADIYLHENTTVSSNFYNWFLANFEEYVPPSSYTCTLDEKTTGLYSFGYIEGDGVIYDENAGTIKGPADSFFQVQLMPFEGYMVDTFTVTDSDGTAKSIVKNSDTLYTITFDSEDFVLNVSATVKKLEYVLTCEYEGALNYTVTYGTIGDITREGDVFTGQPGASAYVRISPKDGYIMRTLSYQITDGSVASVTPGSSNNYTIVLTSSDATILFSVVATAQIVDISSGYYWMQCRNYGTDFSELTLQPGQFQIVETISSSGIVWQDLTGLVCGAGKLSFRLPGDKRITVYTVTETHDDFSLSSGVVISDQGNIVAGRDYDYYSTLWAANWYPVIYVPSNIMEGEVSDILVSFFKSSSVYKADPVYYSGFYLTKKDTIANSNAFYNTYLGIYVPVANTLVSPSSVSFIPDSGGVSNITYKSALNFMGDVSSGEYVIYCGYDYNYNSTVSYNRVGRIPPAPKSGTYMESIYIYPTIMPERLYNLMASWFDITLGPVVPDPPPSSYWDGLEEVLSYEIFGIPLSSLLAIVVSSVFVVVVIRLFAGG